MDFSLSASSFPVATEVPEGAAHYTAVLDSVNTANRIFFLPPHRRVSAGWVKHSSKSERFVNHTLRRFPAAPKAFPPTGPRILQQRPDSSSVSVTTLSAPRRLRPNAVSGARIVHMHNRFGKGNDGIISMRL
ncbi:hypothetical protein [Aerolutibacter ruishenii]|uniref:hypothetical protein n=1 Tax=Aerolutibacter ruishenii TaxID=686800 RepID=UPI00119FA098|nr:hypothetical protein [Lysobacter ruishenii]